MDRGTANDLMTEVDTPINAATLERLERDAASCTWAGRCFFAVAIVVGIALLGIAYHLTGVYVSDLEGAKDPSLMLILLLVRGTLFGGLSVGFLYGIFTVGNAYVDQATRFRKRLYSAHMLNYAFDNFAEEIKNERVKIEDIVRLFSAWNANVDSAFSRVAFQKTSKNLVISGGAQRVATEDPPRAPEERERGWPGFIGIPLVSDRQNGGGSEPREGT